MLKYDDYESSVVLFDGGDDDIKRMIEMDVPFYQRGNIDRAPVNTPEDKYE